MLLRGVEFKRAWNAAGARGFFGEGYQFHNYLGPLRPRFAGATFVAKTTTVEPRVGNMPMSGTTPLDLFPACIKVNFRKAAVLNAVGLSGPGLGALLQDGRWQSRLEPFFLSFMAVEADVTARINKAAAAAVFIAKQRHRFRAPFGIEVNFSCPNVGCDDTEMLQGCLGSLTAMARRLPGVPLVPKFNALLPYATARQVAYHKDCAAICVSNTIPWGAGHIIDWKGLFGEVSPLAHLGGGGLSGAPVAPLVRSWIDAIKHGDTPFPCPIIGGGGVTDVPKALALLVAGADAVEVGSVAIVRPWRVAGIIDAINNYEGDSCIM
jgi:dihydroorotate dehydrogenase (NAD+) catalytic subunit